MKDEFSFCDCTYAVTVERPNLPGVVRVIVFEKDDLGYKSVNDIFEVEEAKMSFIRRSLKEFEDSLCRLHYINENGDWVKPNGRMTALGMALKVNKKREAAK